MSIERLFKMAYLGLKGNVFLSNGIVSVEKIFNRIGYKEEGNIITFSVEEIQGGCYGSISFSVDAIVDISGCGDKENPKEYLNVNIKLKDDITISIKILC